ncbi:MAG: hypothetical protein COB97_01350 [Paracoccus sp.]|nr:MAG: hypothetical protein COB97_01350 [Paracoccus sp. (in: a-proteobacteria)]
MQGLYIRLAKGHSCQKSIRVKEKMTKKLDDSHLYQFFPQSNTFKFYKVVATPGNEMVEVKKVAVSTTDLGLGINLDWSKVGVYKFRFYDGSGVTQTLPLAGFSGKALRVTTPICKYIMSIPTPVLLET